MTRPTFPKRFALPTSLTATLIASALVGAPVNAQDRDEFSVCWSIYAGWMPWGYAEEAGIVDRWAEKYGIDIDVIQVNDYVESINQFTSGNVDGCAMTNMDALTIPAASGVDYAVMGDRQTDGELTEDFRVKRMKRFRCFPE
ncbi:MAG: hypothetical protein ABR580_12250, partial [Halomonas sp.]